MKFKAVLLFLIFVLWRCEGSLLGGILSTAHEHVHSQVHDVAGAILGSLNKGLNLNFQGHIGVNEQGRPGNGYRPPEGSHENFGTNDGPYENNYGQGPYGYRPIQNGFHHPINNNERPYAHNFNGHNKPFQNGHNYNHQGNGNQKYPNNPNYDNNIQEFPNNDNYGYNSQGHPNNQNYGNNEYDYHNNQNHDYPNNQNYPHNEYNSQNNINKPNHGNGPGNPNNEFISTQSQNNQNSPSTLSKPEFTTPIATYATEDNNSKEDDTATQNQTVDDVPLFIPLGPNDYMYGGDKINVTAPKRQTDNKPQAVEEEDFPIDIRFKDD